MKQAILITSNNIDKDRLTLQKYSSIKVKEHEPYNELSGFAYNGNKWYLLILEKNDWRSICKKNRINYYHSFSMNEIKMFFVKVIKCSVFCYPENKTLIGKIMQVMIDPVNTQYYLIYPPLPIQRLCHSDGNYSRKGYIYGVHISDCVKTDDKNEKLIAEMVLVKFGLLETQVIIGDLKEYYVNVAGECNYKLNRITLNQNLKYTSMEYIIDVVLHEVAHVLHGDIYNSGGQGKEWITIARAIGVSENHLKRYLEYLR